MSNLFHSLLYNCAFSRSPHCFLLTRSSHMSVESASFVTYRTEYIMFMLMILWFGCHRITSAAMRRSRRCNLQLSPSHKAFLSLYMFYGLVLVLVPVKISAFSIRFSIHLYTKNPACTNGFLSHDRFSMVCACKSNNAYRQDWHISILNVLKNEWLQFPKKFKPFSFYISFEHSPMSFPNSVNFRPFRVLFNVT